MDPAKFIAQTSFPVPAQPELQPEITVSVNQDTLSILKANYQTVRYDAKVVKINGRKAAFVYMYLGNDSPVSISELNLWKTIFSVRFDAPYLAYYTATMFGFYSTDVALVAILPDDSSIRLAGNFIHGVNDSFVSKFTNASGAFIAKGFDMLIRQYKLNTNNRYVTIAGLFIPVASVEFETS